MTDRKSPASEEEFIRLVCEHQASLRVFVRSLGVDAEWVDDVAQETFFIAYRRFHEFDRTLSFAAWLRGIARNIVANERRKEARRWRILSESATTLLAAEPCRPAEPEDHSAMVRALKECLESLPEKYGDLLRERYQGQENASTLSERLHLSPVGVRRALMRARALLHGCILGKIGEAAP